MTYKNIKFEDSEIMRSLEKLTLKNAKPEEFKKSASIDKSAELKPGEDFSENVLKLCKGLRQTGFDKYADEIEHKFVQFKKAQTLYETSKETGEDLVDQAHPGGSYKMKDLEGDAVFETITDRQKKIKDVVQKTPTGKLASQNAINAVKILLAQDQSNVQLLATEDIAQMSDDQLNDLIENNLGALKQKFLAIHQEVKDEGGLVLRFPDYLVKANVLLHKIDKRPVSLDSINEIIEGLNGIKDFLSPGITGGVSAQAWDIIESMFKQFTPYVSNVKHAVSALNKHRHDAISGTQNSNEPASGARQMQSFTRNTGDQKFSTDINSGVEDLQSFNGLVNINKNLSTTEKQQALAWIADQTKEFKGLEDAFMKMPDDKKSVYLDKYNAALQKLVSENQQFQKDWLS